MRANARNYVQSCYIHLCRGLEVTRRCRQEVSSEVVVGERFTLALHIQLDGARFETQAREILLAEPRFAQLEAEEAHEEALRRDAAVPLRSES